MSEAEFRFQLRSASAKLAYSPTGQYASDGRIVLHTESSKHWYWYVC